MKVLKKILAVAVSVATMAMSVSAFAATYDADTTSVAMTAEELTAEGKVPAATTGQMTVVVVPKTFGENGTVTADNIYYINQEEFGDAFTAIITNMGLKGALATPTDYEVRIGGANLAAPVVFDITVEGGEIIYGDADGNGVVEIADSTLILRNKAGWASAILKEPEADADANGAVEIADSTLILRNKAGWSSAILGPNPAN